MFGLGLGLLGARRRSGPWLLAGGVWNDNGIWRDSAVWEDS